ncbi:MAG TPA: trypsin-like peptidase domain-containing protein [Pirellulaceae bacterium]|nr:trypsin-like peptidase domain-containing protein [Pirellulaceae bacterium]
MTALYLSLVALAAPPSEAVLVEFGSQTCPHCQAMEPILARLAKEGCPVQVIDVDRQPDVARQFKIEGVPTFVALAAGRETGRLKGAATYEMLVALYQKAGGKLPQVVAGAGYQPADVRGQQSAASGAGQQSPQQAALAASVKLRVEDASGYGFGTGTIIDTHDSEALVVTCGHLFRESRGQGKIMGEVVVAGAVQKVEGQMIGYDLDRDVALVSLRVPGAVAPVAVAPPGHAVRPADAAFTVGCDKGADPTVRQTHITAVNKYQGRPNFTAAGQPVDGRSGGGLFSADGKLIGICNAADPADDEGLYAGLASIHWQLDQVGLSEVYQRSGRAAVAAAQPAQPRDSAVALASFEQPAREAAPLPQLPANPPGAAATEPSPVFNASDDSELVVIVRSKRDPQQRSDVYLVDQAPPDLLARIAQAARTTAEQRAELARARTATAPPRQLPYQQPGSPPVVRGQHD